MTQYATVPGGTVKWTYDATANDSDKSFTVPTGKIWVPIMIRSEATCSADVGNRTFTVYFSNGTNVIYHLNKSGSVTASQTFTLLFAIKWREAGTTAANVPLSTGTNPNVCVYGSIPPILLPAGYVIRVYDSAAIAAGADDMTVVINYIEYDA